MPTTETVKYIPCASLPGPFYYQVDVNFPVRTLEWADNYNAVWEELCESGEPYVHIRPLPPPDQ